MRSTLRLLFVLQLCCTAFCQNTTLEENKIDVDQFHSVVTEPVKSSTQHQQTMERRLDDIEERISTLERKTSEIANQVLGQLSDFQIINPEPPETRISLSQINVLTQLSNVQAQISSLLNNFEVLEYKFLKQDELVQSLNSTLTIKKFEETIVTSTTSELQGSRTVPQLNDKSKDDFDCCELRKNGSIDTKKYQIQISKSLIVAQCDMDTEGGGWTVIQRRTLDGINVSFNREWIAYEQEFGDVPQSYWIGLGNIAYLTRKGDQEIRFDMEAFNVTKGKAYAKYGHFHVSGPEHKYRLSIGNYSGTAGNSMEWFNGMQFSTVDNDNDKSNVNCAKDRRGGSWYNSCAYAHPNGIIYSTENYDGKSVYWRSFHDYNSLKFMEIKIRNKIPALCGL